MTFLTANFLILVNDTYAQRIPEFHSAGGVGVDRDREGYISFAGQEKEPKPPAETTREEEILIVLLGTFEVYRIKFDGTDLQKLTDAPNPGDAAVSVSDLRYDLPERADVVITIYDIIGREVRSLMRGMEEPGFKSVLWNRTNDLGELISGGVYLYRIMVGNHIRTRKMILIR